MTDLSPLISIIVPVYNTGAFLHDCVAGVLSQTFPHWELILVNDGSCDDSGEICDLLVQRDDRLRVIHQKNGGLSVARNTGFSVAQGRYTLFLDSDDFYFDATFFETVFSYMEDSLAQVVCFEYVRYVHGHTPPVSSAGAPAIVKTSKFTLVEKNWFQSSAATKFFRTSFLKEYNLQFIVGQIGEDVPYSAQILSRATHIAYYSKQVYAYRVRKASITSVISKKHVYDLLCTVENLSKKAPSMPDSDCVLSYLAFQYCTLLINWRRAGSPCDLHQKDRLKKLSYLLQYRSYFVVRWVYRFYRIFGFVLTSVFLYLYFQFSSFLRFLVSFVR